ncbi:class I SAM-dependent methyltransferase [Terriglobus saanensis]|uniref:Methyltransferase domain-containing protein n=1 Tax=Terriglobus saanensis (strain ATCC BAA-1853 / DSM 23119 / SP1PR4) TaxID=401053 RepID=E8V5V9_TERSS|nr:class I SAM-dependent methyltransferase [Terriglobus saanensis]ADV83777.1 hypothetical protein AciPR4_3018 [Terriglobus saanensis SP1PR4]
MKGFDRVARLYRWAEYATFGPILSRCRLEFLSTATDAQLALVLGDGDGRFTAALIGSSPQIVVDAVDQSTEMLRLLSARCDSERVHTHCIDAMRFDVRGPYDLIATHFFLDCLSTSDVHTLSLRIAASSAPKALWLISDFNIPTGVMHWPARMLIRFLYLAFRILAGLRIQQLPAWRRALGEAGFQCLGSVPRLGGILIAEMWELQPPVRIR